MKLYLISAATKGYDVYSDAVVAATSPKQASMIHPRGCHIDEDHYGSWVKSPSEVTVELIGTAKRGTKQGVICASFHAG